MIAQQKAYEKKVADTEMELTTISNNLSKKTIQSQKWGQNQMILLNIHYILWCCCFKQAR